uniref:Uncharacterized protein n=1 Tax=Opuntia streptacantha TaxID=393608 RepID=A0A7C9CZH1_OPUST
MFPRSLYLLTIMAESDGVGLNKLQFTTKIPISLGLTPVVAKRSSRAPNITSSASFLAAAIDGRGGIECIAIGTTVSSPNPERSRIFLWNSREDSSKSPVNLECSMKSLNLTRR